MLVDKRSGRNTIYYADIRCLSYDRTSWREMRNARSYHISVAWRMRYAGVRRLYRRCGASFRTNGRLYHRVSVFSACHVGYGNTHRQVNCIFVSCNDDRFNDLLCVWNYMVCYSIQQTGRVRQPHFSPKHVCHTVHRP